MSTETHVPEPHLTDAAPRTSGALLRRTLRRQRRPLAASVALVTVWQVAELLVPVLIGVIIDRAVVTGDVARMAWWAVVLAGHFVVLSLSYRYGARIGLRALQTESHALRTEVSAHVLSPRGARTDRLPGDVLTVATTDAEMVAAVLRQVSFTAAAVVGLVVSAVVLAAIDLVLALVVLVGVPTVLGVTQALSPRLARRSEVRQEALGRATGLASDFVRGARPLKGIGAEEVALDRYRRQSRQAATASVGAARWEGLMHGMTSGLSGVFLAVVALVAGVRAVEGDLAIGELVAVVGLSQFLSEPLRMLTYLIAQLAQSRASAGRIASFLASPPLVLAADTPAAAPAAPSRAPLALDAVGFGPLRDVSLAAEPGTLTAVVVEDPTEAAALMTLLRGEAVPDSGAVLVGGVALTAQTVDQVRSVLLVADHHVDLFEGTVLSNIDPTGRLGPDELQRVLAASAADELVAQAAAGTAEQVTVGGTTLSGGQRQRLGLARALAADPHVLVLHDPTTSVDTVTEARIAEGLRALRHPDGPGTRSTVVLTSSPALLARADVVVHLRDGLVRARGTHADLVRDEAYAAAVLR
ncbi:ABC transporter ATP-binding protein [Nocardioides dongkuii]|uniref:ABC transporter ATP-binding protein n=1 Tax=Nocardioides dongkuii TaxID=2760089 RepID=UPI001C7018E6|nr:ABC transporter ATP-binding protein [Nocardioides dongkuii]